jgi:dihydroxyacetone kinase
MTQDEIMSLWNEHADGMNGDTLMRFANAVAAKEREACGEAAMKAAEKAVDVAIKLEREACAKVCDEFNFGQAPMMIQRAIRARGQA